MRIDVLTIFPGYFSGVLETSLIGKARVRGELDVRVHQLRDWTTDRHHTVDDAPYGGGHGMVMKVEPLVRAIEALTVPGMRKILLAARGRPLRQAQVVELARLPALLLICGRYEGVDERVLEYVDDAICVGDYVLSGGEAAAAIVIDAVSRLVPGVIGNAGSLTEESFTSGGLEYPQYTRPEEFRGARVPQVLLSGDHAAIARWRRDAAHETTRRLRPDLLEAKGEDGSDP